MLSTISTRPFLSMHCHRYMGRSVHGWPILTPGTSLSTALSYTVWHVPSGSKCRGHAATAPTEPHVEEKEMLQPKRFHLGWFVNFTVNAWHEPWADNHG